MKTQRLLLTIAALAVILTNPALAQTWTQTSAPITNWTSVASSADGTKLVALVYGGPIYKSTNSGATWTITTAPITNWQAAAASADGTKLVAVVDGGQIYLSSNSGETWAAASTPATNWFAIG